MDIKREIKHAQEALGIKKLRKPQIKPINSVLSGRDTFVIAPTSAGKSLIYQIPALVSSGMTLVIEPTLSLIYDQVRKLQLKGIPAEFISSDLNSSEKKAIMRKCTKQKVKILFVTPERLQEQSFQKMVQSVSIGMVVVDECHTVTTWGYGFRSDYLKIGDFINILSGRPIVTALTATASPDERIEIMELLSMNDPVVHVNSLYRSNLHLTKQVFLSDEDKLKALKKTLKNHHSGSCIIYCNTRRMTDAVYGEIKNWYPDAVAKCHSNMCGGMRKASELSFLKGDRRIMVATSAFGMGIDQSDVDLVIHFNLPLSIADYYQQSGRAGRAGQKASCMLLYCENDYVVNRLMLKETEDKKARKKALLQLDLMKEYAESSDCLMQQMLYALGENKDKPCGSCTNCQRRRKKHDV